MERGSLDVNGIRMQWEEQGQGHPIIFIHGIPTSPRLWRHVIPRIGSGRTLAWEMVGYGASIPEGRQRNISIARQAEYLASWMRALGLEAALLVGHDLGGGVAQILAVRHPALVSGLVLINSISYDSWPIPSVKAMRTLDPLIARLPKPVLRLVFLLFLSRGHTTMAQARAALAEHFPFYSRTGGAQAFARQVRALDVRDTLAIADHLPSLKLPARLVWGAADQFQPIGYGYRLAHDLQAPLDRIEHGKHYVPEDCPDRVAAAVNELLPTTRAVGR